jgi:hypothetical protein
MSDLIKAIVSIKDPFTLFAFVAVVLLIAFRTKTVPESVFRLVSEKITRERFYALLNRSLHFAFALFLALCGIAALGQVLNYKTKVREATVEELKAELAVRHAGDSAARHAIEEYQRGLALAHNQRLGEAIASLESSLKAVPTATARQTLALLYEKAGNSQRATQVAEQGVSAARETGSALKTAKAERLLRTVSASSRPALPESCPKNVGLIGPKLDLPPGGDAFETAPPLVPCVYKGTTDSDQWMYYKLSVQRGQTLKVVLRTRDTDRFTLTYVRLHGPNGATLGEQKAYGGSNVTPPLEYKAEEPAVVYVSLSGGVRGAAFEFSTR